LNGAEVVLVPTANSDKFTNTVTIPQRACENHLFIAYVNHAGVETGKKYDGMSCVCAPNGDILRIASADNEESFFVDLHLDAHSLIQHKQRNPMLETRKPHLYSVITDTST